MLLPGVYSFLYLFYGNKLPRNGAILRTGINAETLIMDACIFMTFYSIKNKHMQYDGLYLFIKNKPMQYDGLHHEKSYG